LSIWPPTQAMGSTEASAGVPVEAAGPVSAAGAAASGGSATASWKPSTHGVTGVASGGGPLGRGGAARSATGPAAGPGSGTVAFSTNAEKLRSALPAAAVFERVTVAVVVPSGTTTARTDAGVTLTTGAGSGTSKASVLSPLELVEPWVAERPRPRRAKAFHS